MTVQRSKTGRITGKKRVHRCESCDRKLKPGRWIFSRHTKKRYCLPGEGCNRG